MTAALRPSFAMPDPVFRLSVEQYHAMIRAGILAADDSVELIEGWIINLSERHVEVYTKPSGATPEPTYGQRQDYPAGAQIPVVLGGQQVGSLAVADLLP